MNDEEKRILDLCRTSNEFKIVVDNDSIWLEQINPYPKDSVAYDRFEPETFRFESFGEDFIVNLLLYIGIDAEHC